MSTVDEVGEDALTSLFAEWLSAPSGGQSPLGDDAAVLPNDVKDMDLLYASDSVIEEIHFLSGTPAEDIGRKAVNRCISDIAAMGGRPKHLLLNLTLPRSTPVSWVEAFMRSAAKASHAMGAEIVGGDLASFEKIQAHVFASGVVPCGQALTRKGANPGDALFVTGTLGGSFKSGHHHSFTPRVEEANWLREHIPVSAMLDLSDGLAADLPRLLKASEVGADVELKDLPLSAEANNDSMFPGWVKAVIEGEDYELLFSADETKSLEWRGDFQKIFDCGLTQIGRILDSSKGLRWLNEVGEEVRLEGSGYQHFE